MYTSHAHETYGRHAARYIMLPAKRGQHNKTDGPPDLPSQCHWGYNLRRVLNGFSYMQ